MSKSISDYKAKYNNMTTSEINKLLVELGLRDYIDYSYITKVEKLAMRDQYYSN